MKRVLLALGATVALAPAAVADANIVSSLSAHAGQVRLGAGQAFTVRDVIADQDGTTHTRLARTWHGLAVLGGDMVVHRSASGAWRGASLTLSRAPSGSAVPAIAAPDTDAR